MASAARRRPRLQPTDQPAAGPHLYGIGAIHLTDTVDSVIITVTLDIACMSDMIVVAEKIDPVIGHGLPPPRIRSDWARLAAAAVAGES
jgi:hypothetical protein